MGEILTKKITFSCHPEDIVYVNGVLDSYGGLGLIRTLDTKKYNCAIYSTTTVYQTALAVLSAIIQEGIGIGEIVIEDTEKVD